MSRNYTSTNITAADTMTHALSANRTTNWHVYATNTCTECKQDHTNWHVYATNTHIHITAKVQLESYLQPRSNSATKFDQIYW